MQNNEVYGIGLLMDGLALVFKQAQAAFQILQFVFVFLIAAPLDKLLFMKFLPLSLGTQLIKRMMIGELPLARPPRPTSYLIANDLLLRAFKLFESAARDRDCWAIIDAPTVPRRSFVAPSVLDTGWAENGSCFPQGDRIEFTIYMQGRDIELNRRKGRNSAAVEEIRQRKWLCAKMGRSLTSSE